MEQGFSIGDYLAILRRRIWWFVIPMVLVMTAALVAALTWPPVYRSTAMVLIEEAEIPAGLVDVSFDTYVERRLEAITRRVMVTDNLIDIIERFDLYPEVRAEQPVTAAAGQMRGDIGIRRISAQQGEATVAFEVFFDYGDAQQAQRVTDELVSLYLNENIRQRRELISGTARFFAAERGRVEERIEELSQQLADFKAEYRELLPQQMRSNERRLWRAEGQLGDLEREENSLVDRETIMMAQMAQIDPHGAGGGSIDSPAQMLENARIRLQTLQARYAPTHPDIVRAEAEVEALAAFVDERGGGEAAAAASELRALSADRSRLERELASLERIYGPAHPDVKQTQRELATVEESLAAQADAVDDLEGVGARNPAYLAMEARLAVIRRQMDLVEERRAEIRQTIENYEELLTRAPEVEVAYNRIAGALQDARAQRNSLLQKEQSARLSEAIETEERGERFSLIEPANLPGVPEEPDRKLIVLVGLVLGIGAGGGAVAARHLLDDTVSGAGEIAAEIGFEPIGIVPNITTPADRMLRLGRRLTVMAAIVVVAGGGAWYVHTRVVPLDIAGLTVWDEVVARVGPYLPSDLQAQLGAGGV